MIQTKDSGIVQQTKMQLVGQDGNSKLQYVMKTVFDGQPHFGYILLCPGFSRPDDLVEAGPDLNPSL